MARYTQRHRQYPYNTFENRFLTKTATPGWNNDGLPIVKPGLQIEFRNLTGVPIRNPALNHHFKIFINV